MSETKPPREFWIPKNYENEFHSGIHVIEYSALLEEKQKVKELVECLRGCIENVHKEREIKMLDLAESAIKKYGDV